MPEHREREVVREQDRIMLVLSYIPVLAVVPLLTVDDSDFVKWHARNGLVLGIGGTLFVGVLSNVLFSLHLCLGLLLGMFLILGFVGVSLAAMVKALRGERWRLKWVSDVADRF